MLFFSFLLSVAYADVDRLSAGQKDLSKVHKVFVSPGLVTVLEFSQNILEVRLGNPKSVKALISQVSPKELTVYLTSSSSVASNLIVRAEKRVFVFDIVPSLSNHQDYIKINGAFGSPRSRVASTVILGERIEPVAIPPAKKIPVKSKTIQRVGL